MSIRRRRTQQGIRFVIIEVREKGVVKAVTCGTERRKICGTLRQQRRGTTVRVVDLTRKRIRMVEQLLVPSVTSPVTRLSIVPDTTDGFRV